VCLGPKVPIRCATRSTREMDFAYAFLARFGAQQVVMQSIRRQSRTARFRA